MENRNGLCVDILVTESTQAEHCAARTMLTRACRRRIHPKTLVANKGYDVKDCVAHLREHQIRPHIVRIDNCDRPGHDGRTTRTEGSRIRQRKRKRVEDIFGWLETVGGLRKTRVIGLAKTQTAAFISGAAYNLSKVAKLSDSEVAAWPARPKGVRRLRWVAGNMRIKLQIQFSRRSQHENQPEPFGWCGIQHSCAGLLRVVTHLVTRE